MGHGQALVHDSKNNPIIVDKGQIIFITALIFSLAGFVYALLYLEYSGFTTLALIPAVICAVAAHHIAQGEKPKTQGVGIEQLKLNTIKFRKKHSIAANLYGVTFVAVYHAIPAI